MIQQAKLIECHPIFHNITLLIKNFHSSWSPTIHRMKIFFNNMKSWPPLPTYETLFHLFSYFLILYSFSYLRTLKYQIYQIFMYNQSIGYPYGTGTPIRSTPYYQLRVQQHTINMLFVCYFSAWGGVSTELHTVETSTSSYRVK